MMSANSEGHDVRWTDGPYLIGVDGGGTGTRVVVAVRGINAVPEVLARAQAGPSGLALGVDRAWAAIRSASQAAFSHIGVPLDWSRCSLGCGLAGANYHPWRAAFRAQAPAALRALHVETDAYTTVLGAHAGAPGVVIALGTGSVGLALHADQTIAMTGGFGFPSGDEASGAWLGLRAIAHAQRAVDGRGLRDPFATALLEAIDAPISQSVSQQRDVLQAWVIGADQTAYASLAPIVASHRGHPVAEALLKQAALDTADMIRAVDPDGILPVALCGSLSPVVAPYMAPVDRQRLVAPRFDSAYGALLVAIGALEDMQDDTRTRTSSRDDDADLTQ